MIRRAALLLFFVLLACSEREPAKPLSEAGERLYPIRGVVLSRDTGSNSINLDHEAIPGFMEAMKMDYAVRGSDIAALPEKARIEAKLHVTDRAYWLTDVKPLP
ncbi:MAG: copper-binding protein [Acidobacteriota bacterium]|nr:copper-binding protein [Acidobacteriota bacterium]